MSLRVQTPKCKNSAVKKLWVVSLLSIKYLKKTFVANVTTQVVERHVVRGLEGIFSPVVVNSMSDTEVQAIAFEPQAARRHREFLEDRLSKLEEGHEIFRGAMVGTSVV